jgi:hypothetical protein
MAEPEILRREKLTVRTGFETPGLTSETRGENRVLHRATGGLKGAAKRLRMRRARVDRELET